MMPTSLQEFLREAGLREVFVPPSLAREVEQVGEWVFGTREDAGNLYEFVAFVQEAATRNIDDYVLIGQAGHGIQSYAMHYYLVEGQLALFLQLAWGGAYGNHEEERATIAEQFALIPQLYAVAAESDLPEEYRLVVALSDLYGSRWGLLPAEMGKEEFLEYGDWQTEDGVDLRSVVDWLNSETIQDTK